MRQIMTERFFWGLIITLLGVNWLLNNAGVYALETGDLIVRFWPVIVIYFGFKGMFDATLRSGAEGRGPQWASLVVNLVITLVFVGVLGNLNDWWYVDLSLVWKLLLPAGLLFVGISMMMGGVRHPSARTYWAIMSGSEDVRTSWDDLSIVNIMGGAVVDLSRAGLPEREVQIDAYSLMGGGDLVVPPGVKVICEETSLMGGVKVLGLDAGGVLDRRVIEAGEGPVVRVRSLAIMGGFDVKLGNRA